MLLPTELDKCFEGQVGLENKFPSPPAGRGDGAVKLLLERVPVVAENQDVLVPPAAKFGPGISFKVFCHPAANQGNFPCFLSFT